MNWLVLRGPRDVRLEAFSDPPPPTENQVSIRTELGLISAGTERRLYLGMPVPAIVSEGFEEALRTNGVVTEPLGRYAVSGTNRPVTPGYPTSLGYNAVGVVEAIGPEAQGLSTGDRVISTGPHSERLVLPDWQVVPVPHGVPSEEAIFTYLSTLGLSALRRVQFRSGEYVVVLGLGVVGLTAALVAVASGARVIVADTEPARRDIAGRTGRFAAVLDPLDGDYAERIEAIVEPEKVDHVIETAGRATALSDAIRIVGWRGHIAVLALYSEGVAGDLLADRFHEKECSVVSCANDAMADPRRWPDRFTVGGNMRFVLEMLATSRISFAGLMSRTFPIQQAAEAYAVAAVGDPSVMGVGLNWNAPAQA